MIVGKGADHQLVVGRHRARVPHHAPGGDVGGAGIPDYSSKPGELAVGTYEFGAAFMAQVKAVLFTLVFSGVGSLILFKIVDVIVGLRVAPDAEREGLDIAEHGERAYHA